MKSGGLGVYVPRLIAIVVAGFCLVNGRAAAFTADLSHGEVSLKVESAADTISAAHDFMLTVTVETPVNLQVVLPDLRDRFQGFTTAEEFAVDPIEVGGRRRSVQRWRLVPEPAAARYRLAPFAVTVIDKSGAEARASTFATQPVLFPPPGVRPVVTGDPEVLVAPINIPPTARMVARWVVFGLGALALIAAMLYGLKQLGRRVREMRMSPVERAMSELQRLLGRNLPTRGLFKEFYIELTMVVRRYIERTRGIKAPGQTTQEFMAVATDHPSFTPEVVAQLKSFLESADLIKFAGQQATTAMSDAAAQRARDYITNDKFEAQMD